MLSETRDEAAATAFFRRAITSNGFPNRVVIDKSGSNMAGLNNVNMSLLWNGWFWLFDVLQVKYLNNIIEHRSHRLQANDCRAVDHLFIKALTKQILLGICFAKPARQWKGFKSFDSASATLGGIDVAHMIRKQEFGASGTSAFQQFAALAG